MWPFSNLDINDFIKEDVRAINLRNHRNFINFATSNKGRVKRIKNKRRRK